MPAAPEGLGEGGDVGVLAARARGTERQGARVYGHDRDPQAAPARGEDACCTARTSTWPTVLTCQRPYPGRLVVNINGRVATGSGDF
ncbi:hypothetical protein GCM10009827_065010 [Dactylosporangium maewongense]|uniref:Uncharacterized protein n=1 Tax=Dactylosporangium maewongense TaxID=634393 RepID=A0ABP4M4V1_9ACTN